MFKYVGKQGFGQYKVQCSVCGYVAIVGTVSFRDKLYEQLSCDHCIETGKKSRDDAYTEAFLKNREYWRRVNELYTVAIVDNRITLR